MVSTTQKPSQKVVEVLVLYPKVSLQVGEEALVIHKHVQRLPILGYFPMITEIPMLEEAILGV